MTANRFVLEERSDRAAARRLGGNRAPHAPPRRAAGLQPDAGKASRLSLPALHAERLRGDQRSAGRPSASQARSGSPPIMSTARCRQRTTGSRTTPTISTLTTPSRDARLAASSRSRRAGEADGDDTFLIRQRLEWRGPSEWAAPQGRIAATEERFCRVAITDGAYVIDVESRLAAADWDFVIGPTRHSYFNVRLAEGIAVTSGGTVRRRCRPLGRRGDHRQRCALGGLFRPGRRRTHRAGVAVFPIRAITPTSPGSSPIGAW